MTNLTVNTSIKQYDSSPKILDKSVQLKSTPVKAFFHDGVKVAGTGAATLLAGGIPAVGLAHVFQAESVGLVGISLTATATATSMLVSALKIDNKVKGASIGAGYGVIAGLAVGGLSYALEKNGAFFLASAAVGLTGGAIGGLIGAYSNKIAK